MPHLSDAQADALDCGVQVYGEGRQHGSMHILDLSGLHSGLCEALRHGPGRKDVACPGMV